MLAICWDLSVSVISALTTKLVSQITLDSMWAKLILMLKTMVLKFNFEGQYLVSFGRWWKKKISGTWNVEFWLKKTFCKKMNIESYWNESLGYWHLCHRLFADCSVWEVTMAKRHKCVCFDNAQPTERQTVGDVCAKVVKCIYLMFMGVRT